MFPEKRQVEKKKRKKERASPLTEVLLPYRGGGVCIGVFNDLFSRNVSSRLDGRRTYAAPAGHLWSQIKAPVASCSLPVAQETNSVASPSFWSPPGKICSSDRLTGNHGCLTLEARRDFAETSEGGDSSDLGILFREKFFHRRRHGCHQPTRQIRALRLPDGSVRLLRWLWNL